MIDTKKSGISPRTKIIITSILLLLTLVSPFIGLVGVFVMWFWTAWKRWVKIIITVPIILLIVVPVIFIFVYIFFFRPFKVVGSAMDPTYKNGEYLVSEVIRGGSIQRGDVVVFIAPKQENTEFKNDFIKRVIGVTGDTIMLKDGNVYRNGQLLDEGAYLKRDVKTYGGAFVKEGKSVIVPENSYLVFGDNRPYSSDSREWGFVTRKDVISKVLFCYFNCNK